MNNQPHEFEWIDRLASGDLSGSERRELFAWLDRDLSRWRRCALALLEARELDETFVDWRAESQPRTVTAALTPVRRPFHPNSVLALAASVIIAFVLGLVARGWSQVEAPNVAELPRPAAAAAGQQAIAEKSPVVVPDQAASDERPVQTIASTASVPPTGVIPAYIRSQLERQGYQLRSQHGRLPVVLPDGRRGTIPVDELQVNYVGQQTY